MRSSGVLLPVFSLPGPYGIGSLGENAYRFLDFLSEAGQRYWQILPVGPTGYGDSPYQSFSAFAGNPYFVDLDLLCQWGLLLPQECEAHHHGTALVNYEWLFQTRLPLLKKAVSRLTDAAFADFCSQQAFWLQDYALFMALKEENGNCSWQEWPLELRLSHPEALQSARNRLAEQMLFWQGVQYLFHRQWQLLKEYAHSKNVALLGDIPIYVAPDSSDVWANPTLFQTNDQKQMTHVAGVPPDAFSATGQLWGNPLYDWDYHKSTGFAWWIQRLRHAASLYDSTRIDHFRGFADYYAIPAQHSTAVEGAWHKGPDIAFVQAIQSALPDMSIVAEDLGELSHDARLLLKNSGIPGMKVLQFAFGGGTDNEYLPHNHIPNCIVYTGTHDNNTTAGWAQQASSYEADFAQRYLNCGSRQELTAGMVRAALSSVADTAIVPLQDWLELGETARINAPSTLGGNWVWRLIELPSQEATQQIREWSLLYGRGLFYK